MLSFVIFMFCFTFGGTILVLWIISAVKEGIAQTENETKINSCLRRMTDYTSYKKCFNSCLLLTNDKTGSISFVYALSAYSSPFVMNKIEEIETKVVKGETVDHYETRTVVKTDGSRLGSVIRGSAMLNTFGVAVLSSPRKRIEKETVKHTYKTDAKYYVSIRYHVGRIIDTFDVQTNDEKEMNEVANYLNNFLTNFKTKNG